MVRRQNRNAVIAILVLLLLPVLLVILGFSIDLATMQQARTELRSATDLAAKATAAELSATSDLDLAIAAGQEIAINNRVVGVRLTLEDSDFVFGRSQRQENGKWLFTPELTPHNAVRVTGRRTADSTNGAVRLTFGRFYGSPTFESAIPATASFVDIDICLVLDRSSSMKLAVTDTGGGMSSGDSRFCVPPELDSRWVALEAAVGVFVGAMSTSSANERVAVTFASDFVSSCGETNTESSLDQDLTAALPLVTSAMAARSATVWNGGTHIDAGIETAHQVLIGPSSRPLADKVMIVFTDGVYTGADPVPFATAAKQDEVVVHTVTFSAGADQDHMNAVADAGGGDHYHADDADALAQIFRDLAGRLVILTE